MERNCADVVTISNTSAHAPETKKLRALGSHNEEAVLHVWVPAQEMPLENRKRGYWFILQENSFGWQISSC